MSTQLWRDLSERKPTAEDVQSTCKHPVNRMPQFLVSIKGQIYTMIGTSEDWPVGAEYWQIITPLPQPVDADKEAFEEAWIAKGKSSTPKQEFTDGWNAALAYARKETK